MASNTERGVPEDGRGGISDTARGLAPPALPPPPAEGLMKIGRPIRTASAASPGRSILVLNTGTLREALPEGPVASKVPRVLKLPKGEVYVPCENPRGELGFLVSSDGSNKPHRVHVRAPSFANLQILSHVAPGYSISDLVGLIAMTDIVLGDVDR